MTSAGVLQILVFFAVIFACTKPLGAYMANVFEGRRTFLHPVMRWLEVLTYKIAGVREDVEQRWTQYTASLLAFSIFGFLLVYLLQRAQAYLPFNLQNYALGVTAIPFWHYVGATLVGIVPGLVIYIYFGIFGKGLGNGVGWLDWTLLGLGLLATVALGILVTRRTQAIFEHEGRKR